MKQKLRIYTKAALSANLFLKEINASANFGIAVNFVKNKKQEGFCRMTKALVREVTKNINFLSLSHTQFPFNSYRFSDKVSFKQYMLTTKPELLIANQYFFSRTEMLRKFEIIDEASFFKLFFLQKKVVLKV